MASQTTIEITLEGQAAPPNHRYDLLQPLLQGRVPIEGVTIKPSAAMEPAGYFDNPKFQPANSACSTSTSGT